jgi:hypothetical protein
MRGPTRAIVALALAACAVMALAATQASAATLEDTTITTPLLAVYGNPGFGGATAVPVGGGLARNFGFGANMLFQADNAALSASENFHITLGGELLEVGDMYIGATVTSNTTGTENPLGMEIEFVDPQESKLGVASVAWYADTADRPWLTQICGESTSCKVDTRQTEGAAHEVKIEDAAFAFAGFVLQGTLWGKWENGTESTPPCIKFGKAPSTALEYDELVETEGPVIGAKPGAIAGKACLVSANNEYPPKTHVIKIK